MSDAGILTCPHVRWMIRRDMAEVLGIESEAFEFPWEEKDFIAALRIRNTISMVAEHDGRIAGFMVYELHKTRIRLLDIAVDWKYRGLGIGKAMIDKIKNRNRREITTKVCETNLDAQLFFKACGFRCCNILHGFYEDDVTDDAYVFRYVRESARVLDRRCKGK